MARHGPASPRRRDGRPSAGRCTRTGGNVPAGPCRSRLRGAGSAFRSPPCTAELAPEQLERALAGLLGGRPDRPRSGRLPAARLIRDGRPGPAGTGAGNLEPRARFGHSLGVDAPGAVTMTAPVSCGGPARPSSGFTLKYGQGRGTFGHNHDDGPPLGLPVVRGRRARRLPRPRRGGDSGDRLRCRGHVAPPQGLPGRHLQGGGRSTGTGHCIGRPGLPPDAEPPGGYGPGSVCSATSHLTGPSGACSSWPR